MSIYLKNFIRFWIIVLIQVYILDKVALRWWSQPSGFPIFVPYLYPLFLLLLPFETPVWAMLLLGFGLGITVDSFSDTAGMHACAAVLLAYLRTNVLKALLPKNLVEYPNQSPNVKNMGWVPFGLCKFSFTSASCYVFHHRNLVAATCRHSIFENFCIHSYFFAIGVGLFVAVHQRSEILEVF